jgi:membrane protein
MKAGAILGLLKQTVNEWLDDRGFTRSASLSYYTVFSIAPLLLIATAVASFAFGREAVTGQLQSELEGMVGESGAKAIQEMMKSASKPGAGIVATILGVAMVVIGATGAFVELQDTLNDMWGVDKNKSSGIIGFLRARVVSLAMVLVIAFLLLVSLVVSTGLSAVGAYSAQVLPAWQITLQIVNLVASFLVITLLFAAIYKVLPNVKIAWRDVWLGAAVTSVLFSIGKLLIGLYLGKSSASSSYGAAGSFAVLLIWINFSSMILFLGAEFTQVVSRARRGIKDKGGSEVVPAPTAQSVEAQTLPRNDVDPLPPKETKDGAIPGA